MNIYLQFTGNEAEHLKALEEKQTFIFRSEKMEFVTENRGGEICFQIRGQMGTRKIDGSAIYVKIPQADILGDTPLPCKTIDYDY